MQELTFDSRSGSCGLDIYTAAENEVFECMKSGLGKPVFVLTSGQSAKGISFKSQAIYFLVYITRYLGQSTRRKTATGNVQ